MDEAIAARSKVRAGRLFGYAETVAEWGMLDKAVQLFDRGLALARQAPEDADLDASRIAQYVRTAARVRTPVELFRQLEDVGADFWRKARTPDNVHAQEAETLAEAVGEVERNAFADAVRAYGSPEERDALDAAVRKTVSALSSLSEREKYVTIAQNAGLVLAEEEIRTGNLGLGYASCDADKGSSYQAALNQLTAMYQRRGQYARAAEVLATYRDKKPVCGVVAYNTQIAENYRLAGDVPREIEALTRIYDTASGDIVTSDSGDAASVRRLLELLVSTNRRDRLVELAGRSNAYQLVLVNFLLERGDEELARRAIANTKLSPAWVKAKTGQVGIFFGDGSQERYHASLDAFYDRPRDLRTDDGDPLGGRRANWDPKLPEPPEHFHESPTLTLARYEGEYLRDEIQASAPDSLFAAMVRERRAPDQEFPWDDPENLDHSSAIRRQLLHAQNLSEVMHGAALLYNLILAELTKNDELVSEYQNSIHEWAALVGRRMSELKAWDLDDLWRCVEGGGARVGIPTKLFVTDWCRVALSDDGAASATSKRARDLVERRERALKRRLARVDNQRARERWGGAAGTARLNYRWPNAARIATDIIDVTSRRGDA
jgi:hypothetical protein